MKTNATIEQLQAALTVVNRDYDPENGGNIWLREVKQLSRLRVQFTLRVFDSKGPGAARSASGRRTNSACWHVHGRFFDALRLWFGGPDIYIISNGNRIDRIGGNWKDYNRGSQAKMASTCCDCHAVAPAPVVAPQPQVNLKYASVDKVVRAWRKA